jgi:hypothetical protein
MKPIYLGNSPLVAYIDDVDYLDCMFFSFVLNRGYARRHDNQLLHVLIGRKIGIVGEVDHEDRNKLNNCRTNLRSATSQQNKFNIGKREGTLSMYKGVTWDQRTSRWLAHIRFNGKTKHLGRFDCEKTAARKYNQAARMYFKEFAVLNEV